VGWNREGKRRVAPYSREGPDIALPENFWKKLGQNPPFWFIFGKIMLRPVVDYSEIRDIALIPTSNIEPESVSHIPLDLFLPRRLSMQELTGDRIVTIHWHRHLLKGFWDRCAVRVNSHVIFAARCRSGRRAVLRHQHSTTAAILRQQHINACNDLLIYWIKVLRPTRHKIGHLRDALPSQVPNTKSNSTKANMHPYQNIQHKRNKNYSQVTEQVYF